MVMLYEMDVLCGVYYVVLMLFFFFKQKTAYEMRISDWSSDVCSSDLPLSSPASEDSGARVATSTDLPASRNRRAAMNPSPPLLPGPQSTMKGDRKSVV